MISKLAIVTGSSGQLGKAFCQTLIENNYIVYGLDLNPESPFDNNHNYHHKAIDITDETAVIDFIKQFDKINLLINNAGIGVFTPMEERTVDDFMNVMKVNLLGSFIITRETIKFMKRNQGGKIINIGSIYGTVSSDSRIYGDSGRNNSEIYSITKAGIIQFTKYLAAHYAKFNIQSNCISPGGVFRNQNEFFTHNYKYRTPAERMGTESDMQSALEFLISEKNNYLNGQNIIVDGGFTSW